MTALLLTLGMPLLGGLVLALFGHRDRALELNAGFSFATFLATAALTIQIIAVGPILVLGKQFFVDSLNVLLVALTAFVAFNTALFSRPYMRVERDRGKMTPGRMRLYHSMFQLSASPCCWRCSPTTWAFYGSPWRRQPWQRCCW